MEYQLCENELNNEITNYFHYIASYYYEKSNYTLTANYQFKFTHNAITSDWYLSVNQNNIIYNKGIVQSRILRFTHRILYGYRYHQGKKNATFEYMKKSYTIKGPLKILLLFNTYFGSIVTDSRLKTKRQPDTWEYQKTGKWSKQIKWW